jgi:hypothetical protein
MAGVAKHQTTKGKSNYYFGLPARKIFHKKIKKYLKITDKDLEKDKQLSKKQKEKNNTNEK